MAFDEEGQAADCENKVRICKRSYDILVDEVSQPSASFALSLSPGHAFFFSCGVVVGVVRFFGGEMGGGMPLEKQSRNKERKRGRREAEGGREEVYVEAHMGAKTGARRGREDTR